MEEALKGVIRLEQLIKYPDDVKPEHFDEGRAVHSMLNEVKEALNH